MLDYWRISCRYRGRNHCGIWLSSLLSNQLKIAEADKAYQLAKEAEIKSFLLEKFPNVEVVQELDRGEATIYQAISLQPDVVFLDVEMPKMSGIEVAKSLLTLKNVPLIVFATAYPQFAAEALRINAIDYLLKPYCPKQLKQTMDRITYRINEQNSIQQVNSLGKLAVEKDGEFEYIFVKDILYMYPKGKITKIITLSNEYEVKSSLKELESRLAPFNFFRIHRSVILLI